MTATFTVYRLDDSADFEAGLSRAEAEAELARRRSDFPARGGDMFAMVTAERWAELLAEWQAIADEERAADA